MTEQDKKRDGDVKEIFDEFGELLDGGKLRNMETALKIAWNKGYQARCEERIQEIMEEK
jgi:hypothetical protein